MSQLLINQYLGERDRLKKVGATHRESVLRAEIARVPTVSVETMRIVDAIRATGR